MTTSTIFLLGLALTVLTSVYNIGIIAMDDYTSYVAAAVPAQNQGPLFSVWSASILPPVPRTLLRVLARLPYALGVTNPVTQLRVVLGILGLVSFLVVASSALSILKADDPRRERLSRWGLVLIGGYFVCPLLLGRAMVESLSLPFVVGSLALACRYWRTARPAFLAAAVSVLAVGALMRFQVGVLAFALALLPVLRRDAKGFGALAVAGAVFFLATGLVDLAVTGKYHGSLIAYLDYNRFAGERHGSMPFYTFLALFVGLSLPPTFLSRFRGMDWKATYGPLIPAVAYFAVFLGTHSLSPHKEDRFMIPILPVFLLLLAPMLDYFSTQPRQRWRVVYFGVLNTVLLLLVSLSIPQKNIISLATAVDARPEVQTLVGVDDALILFPFAYLSRPLHVRPVSGAQLSSAEPLACDSWLVVREADRQRLPSELRESLEPVGRFAPALPEQLVTKLNPKRNARRGALEAYARRGCPSAS